MNLPRASVKYPVTTTVGVILAVLFGAISLYWIPVQMTPTIDRPVITVETEYRGAAPLEVEEEVSKPIEEKLTSVEGLNRMTSRSEEGKSRVFLEFDWDVNKDVARLDVSEKLGLVRNLPDDSDRSTVNALNSDAENPIAWIIVETKLPINEVRMEADNVIRPKLERVEGVGQVWMFGGQEREVRVTLDYAAMSARGITVSALRAALQRENKNTKAGKIDEGKRRYSVRTVGNFTRLDQLRNTIIAQNANGAVYLRDVAKVSFDYGDLQRRIRLRQVPTMAFGALRKTGANTIEVMAGVKKAIAEINDIYKGRGIRLRQVYDETVYIDQSRSLVINNIFIGGALAIGVLLLFLGSLSSVMIIGVAIPVTVVSTFIFIFVLGRSINIISLAGMAFAVGMVVDNSVVVLENIFRHREMGKSKWDAAVDGAHEVWGAVLASTLTTLAVFVPVVFVQDESGQLFRDIAIAISVAVALSLIVSISVVPMLSSRILSGAGKISPLTHFFRILGVYALGRLCRRIYVATLGWLLRGVVRRVIVAALITAGAIAVAVLSFPPIDYLPKGNRNLLFVIVRTPAGLNLEEVDKVARILEAKLEHVKEIDRYFAVVRTQNPIFGIIAKKEYSDLVSMRNLVQKLFRNLQGTPGVRTFVTQAPLFRRRGSGYIGGINLKVDITGDGLNEIQRIAADVGARARGLGGVRFVNSSFDLGNPELQVHVDRQRAADFGVSVTELGSVVETLVNGTKAGIFRDRGEELDIILRGPLSDFTKTQRIEELKLHTPEGQVVSLGDIAKVKGGARADEGRAYRPGPLRDAHGQHRERTAASGGYRQDEERGHRTDAPDASARLFAGRERTGEGPGANLGVAQVVAAAGAADHLSADGGPVRGVELPVHHHVQRAIRRHGRGADGEPHELVGTVREDGHAHHAGLHHPDGHRGEQRDPARPPGAEPLPRGPAHARGHPRERARQDAPHLHDDHDDRARHAASGDLLGLGQRTLPGAGLGRSGRAGHVHDLHPAADTGRLLAVGGFPGAHPAGELRYGSRRAERGERRAVRARKAPESRQPH